MTLPVSPPSPSSLTPGNAAQVKQEQTRPHRTSRRVRENPPRRRPHGQAPRGPWIRQTGPIDGAFARAANGLDEETFQALYGRWDPLRPGQVAELFAGAAVRWWVVGGRAARIGAPPRPHEDTDVAVSRSHLDELRKALSGWHLWEANDGTLRPVLPGQPLSAECEQLWNRVREQRTQRRLSQAELAGALAVSRQTVISIENGRYLPSLPLAFRIARFFDLPVDKMFTPEDKDLGRMGPARAS